MLDFNLKDRVHAALVSKQGDVEYILLSLIFQGGEGGGCIAQWPRVQILPQPIYLYSGDIKTI